MDFAKLNRAIGYDSLSMEEKIRRAVRAAKLEMHPTWIKTMKSLPPSKKTAGANELFRMARDAMYGQGISRGLEPTAARLDAARRMLNCNDW